MEVQHNERKETMTKPNPRYIVRSAIHRLARWHNTSYTHIVECVMGGSKNFPTIGLLEKIHVELEHHYGYAHADHETRMKFHQDPAHQAELAEATKEAREDAQKYHQELFETHTLNQPRPWRHRCKHRPQVSL